MTSARRTAANLRNSRRSSGPRTAAGKSIASRNALRHGLASATRRPVASAEIERYAKAICGNDIHEEMLAHAITVVENELALRAIREQQLAVIERLRDPTAVALKKGDNGFDLAKAKFLGIWLAHRQITKRLPAILEKYKDEMPRPLVPDDTVPEFLQFHDDIVPIRLKALLQECDSEEEFQRALELAQGQIEERDEYEAFAAAGADLVRLERYERRAWSRYKRAMRAFMGSIMMRDKNSAQTPSPANIVSTSE